ncbi:MAG: tryptophan-rich sensory protein [Candidatus Auribacter fodinae]|jgi:tryptophan-rich sensory protein|uniref:Tryptophan-rich sensory protein n=1 Tax=Candidatus Auribacter fodinae TaxID=2093366 RepID=A0A3A4QWK0_9BACT|nr:MAG: tryptophan-rich sensory protein [Candidatus Auribacter fodinae]
MKSSHFLKLVMLIAVCQCAGIIGSAATLPAIPEWYNNLVKPVFTPPDWIFGPVWITLYTCMGIAAFLISQSNAEKPVVRTALFFFGIQLMLNALWPVIFFGLKAPLAALVEMTILWMFIAITATLFFAIHTVAGALLIPYLLWTSFAMVLNLRLYQLNR